MKPRSHLYVPNDSKSCPVSINRLGLARTTLMIDDKGNLDLKQDNWKSMGDYPIRGEWKGSRSPAGRAEKTPPPTSTASAAPPGRCGLRPPAKASRCRTSVELWREGCQLP